MSSRSRRRRSQRKSKITFRDRLASRSSINKRRWFEVLEDRLLLAADLNYSNLATDMTLRATAGGLQLLQTGTSTVLASVPFDDAGDVLVNITRTPSADAIGDTL